MKMSDYTGKDNYFEDFKVGEVMKHARGKTMEPLEQVMITNLVMNTAEGHFNEDLMAKRSEGSKFAGGRRVSFGGVNISFFVGIASQDTAENAIAELGMDKIKLMSPVFHGDTLYAYSEVLETKPADRDDAGIVRFKHYGVNQDGKQIFEGERTVLIKRRSHWGDR